MGKQRRPIMSKQHAGYLASDGVAANAPPDEAYGLAAWREAAPAIADDSGLLAAADRDHLEREIAAIERASAALRRAEPGLESWTDLPAPTMHKPRPIWFAHRRAVALHCAGDDRRGVRHFRARGLAQ
jgi:hypothetical protein